MLIPTARSRSAIALASSAFARTSMVSALFKLRIASTMLKKSPCFDLYASLEDDTSRRARGITEPEYILISFLLQRVLHMWI